MAATDSMPVPKKNTAFRLYFEVRGDDGELVTGFTSPDSEVSLDGAAFADCTNEATFVGRGTGYIDFTAAEMNADSVVYFMTCTEGDVTVAIAPEEAGDIRVNMTELGGSTQSATDLKDFADDGYDPSSNKVQGVVLVDTATTLTNAPSDSAGVTTLLSRLTSSRADYLDNLNVGGAVASQADINALNQSASRRIILTTVGQYERPESGSTTFQIEARTYTADGVPVNADSTPTLTATGITSGSLAANLGSSTNPSTGVYRWAYTVANDATIEQIRFDLSAVISSDTQVMSVHSQVVDTVAATFTTGDRTKLEAVYNKLPSKNYLTGTANSDGDIQANEATGNFPGSVASVVAGVVVTTNNDKTGYSLTAGYDPAKTAAQEGDEMTLADSEDVYPADIFLTVDGENSRDEYTVQWFRNGAPVTSGVTSPLIQVVKRADGTDLIASTAMTQIGSTGAYKYDAVTSERTTAGEAVLVHVSATINGSSRTWRKLISRDTAEA